MRKAFAALMAFVVLAIGISMSFARGAPEKQMSVHQAITVGSISTIRADEVAALSALTSTSNKLQLAGEAVIANSRATDTSVMAGLSTTVGKRGYQNGPRLDKTPCTGWRASAYNWRT